MQCDSHFQETDITSPNKSNNEVWKLGNVLRRRCGDSVINPRVSHRAIGRSVSCMKGAELKCNPSKCEISKDSKTYFGRMVDKHNIRQTRYRRSRGSTDLEITEDCTSVAELSWLLELLLTIPPSSRGQGMPMQQLMIYKCKKFTWNNAAEESSQRIT